MLLSDLATWLAADASLGLTSTVNLFEGDLPPAPATCVGMMEYGGPDALVAFDGPQLERPRVQFNVRGATYAAGRLLAERIYQKALAARAGFIAGYQAIIPQGPVSFAYRDDQAGNLPVFTVNVEVHKELSALPGA